MSTPSAGIPPFPAAICSRADANYFYIAAILSACHGVPLARGPLDPPCCLEEGAVALKRTSLNDEALATPHF